MSEKQMTKEEFAAAIELGHELVVSVVRDIQAERLTHRPFASIKTPKDNPDSAKKP